MRDCVQLHCRDLLIGICLYPPSEKCVDKLTQHTAIDMSGAFNYPHLKAVEWIDSLFYEPYLLEAHIRTITAGSSVTLGVTTFLTSEYNMWVPETLRLSFASCPQTATPKRTPKRKYARQANWTINP